MNFLLIFNRKAVIMTNEETVFSKVISLHDFIDYVEESKKHKLRADQYHELASLMELGLVAGSSVLSYINYLQGVTTSKQSFNDVDIFLPSHYTNKQMNTKYVCNVNIVFVENKKFGPIDVQLIYCDDPLQVVKSFDIDICQCWIETTHVVNFDRKKRARLSSYLNFSSLKPGNLFTAVMMCPTDEEMRKKLYARVEKYIARGYKVRKIEVLYDKNTDPYTYLLDLKDEKPAEKKVKKVKKTKKAPEVKEEVEEKEVEVEKEVEKEVENNEESSEKTVPEKSEEEGRDDIEFVEKD